MTGELLLEIGTEEIPSGYMDRALEDLKNTALKGFKDNRLELKGLSAYGTPRRLTLIGEGIAQRQEDMVQEVMGPPKSVSYDAEGKPTKAALGFAQKQGVPLEELGCIDTPRGQYLHVKQRVPGKPAQEILQEYLPRLILEMPWPKSMRWGGIGVPFVRPIHWAVALFDGKVIPFEIAGVQSGNVSYGHRFMAPEPFNVSGVKDYREKLKKQFALIDPEERRAVIREAVKTASGEAGGKPSEDPELVNTVSNLVEYPSAVCGSFERSFLTLPEQVLLTSMREHQKYFGVYDNGGKLLPFFVAVNNTVARDVSIVKKGHERVLRARLSDADFFFREDRKRPLGDRLNDLKGVIYQADLGSSYAKVGRFTRLAEFLSESLLPDKVDLVRLAARLCKCDLVTHMVGEFPTLQGVMGGEYARLEGYPEEVCRAIREHYLPDKAGGPLPESKVGAIVGIADRMDTISGCFAVGLEPTGAADPFALRRHALGIIRIFEGMNWDISLDELVMRSLSFLREEIEFDVEAVFGRIQAFIRERYRQLMLRTGFESDLIEAVISVQFDRIQEVRRRMEGLREFSLRSEEFKPLALTFKRVTNILKKEGALREPDPALMREPSESSLWEAYLAVKDDVQDLVQRRDYVSALNLLAGLRRPVDAFFEGVEIMTKEDSIRQNRIGILQCLSRLFLSVADFSRFSI